MGFWIFMLIMDVLVPVTMIGLGKRISKQVPEDMYGLSGYRTAMSRKNRDTWEFANKYFAKIWYISGFIILPLSVVPMLFVIGKNEDIVGNLGAIICFVQCILLVCPILPTEAALKKTFDKNGKRKRF